MARTHMGVLARRALLGVLVVALTTTGLAAPIGPLQRPAAAHTPINPTQPPAWPGYGTQWWDHWWSQVWVDYDVGTCAGSACGIYYHDELYTFTLGAVFWADSTCYSDGCGKMNPVPYVNDQRCVGRCDSDQDPNARGFVFNPSNGPAPRKNATFFSYCKWSLVSPSGDWADCATDTDPNRVETRTIAGFHVMWRATSGDGSVRGAPNGDAFTVQQIPAGYPAPTVVGLNFPGRCNANTNCTATFGDAGTAYPNQFGIGITGVVDSPDPVNLATGSFTAHADDLSLPGRILPFSFTRWYNSADPSSGSLGPGWTHSYNWSLTENPSSAVVRHGDGRQDTFTRRPDGSYLAPSGVFDVLTKNADSSFTLTLVNGVQYEFFGASSPSAYPGAIQATAPGSYWRLNETTGTTATDAGANHLDGTYSGGYTLGVPGALHDSSTAVGFNGSDARITAGTTGMPTGASARSVEAWVNPTGSGGTIFTENAASGQKFIVQIYSTGGSWFLFTDGVNGSNNLTLSGSQVPASGVWSHVVFVFDGAGNGWHYYLNGAPTASGTFATPINTAPLTSVTVGDRLDVPQPFNGSLDEVAVYSSALSAAQVAAHYQASLSKGGLLARIHEPAGNALAFGYAGTDLTTVTDTVGRIVTLSYDSAHRLTSLVDPIGRTTTYGFDASGRLVTVTDKLGNSTGQTPSAHRWQYGYDGSTSHLVSITDPDGRVRVTNTYGGQGRVVQQRDGRNGLTVLVYNTGSTALTDPRGHTTTYTFDAQLREVSESITVSGSPLTISYSYDSAGNRNSVTDRSGNRTDFSFDARGNVLTETDPSPGGAAPRPVTSFQYDARNNLIQMTDALGFVSTSTYDAATNVLLSTTRPIDATTVATTTYAYGDAANPGLPTVVTSPRGNLTATPDPAFATTLAYDAQGNVASRVDPDGAKTTFAYDAIGRQTSFIDPDGNATGATPGSHTWSVTYDANDRETSRTDPLGHVTRTSYDGAGDRTSVTDRAGNVTAYGYDGNARLISTQQRPDPVGQPAVAYSTTVTRDPNGNATSIRQANGAITDYAFDELDRLVSVTTHPDAQTNLVTSYALDGNGQPTRKTTGDGVAVNYVYDALSRLMSVTGPSITITYAYDALGHRLQMTDATGVTTYRYDGLGRMLAAGTLSYAYDRDGNRTQLTDAGSAATYAYSNGGRLATVTDWAGRVSTYTYQASGLVSSLTYPNGMIATYSYDAAQRLTHLKNATATATINEFDYSLDAEGNRLTGDNPNTYDGLNRLVSAGGEHFTFDAASNIATYLAPGAMTATTRTYDAANRLVSDGRQFVWNAADRLVQRGLDTFSYDELGRMTQATIRPITYPSDPIGNIDTPYGGTIDPRTPVTFAGWAIDRNAPSGTGVDTVTLYLDGGPGQGRLLGVATYGDSRPDVGTYFGNHQYDNSGWHFDWTVDGSVALGGHRVFAVFRARATGVTQQISQYIFLDLPYHDDPMGYIDVPTASAAVTGDVVRIAGWGFDRNASSGAGLDSVNVYLDGTDQDHLIGAATYGDSRPDVGTYFGEHRLDNSGWHFDWNTSSLPLGTHTLSVILHSSVLGRTVTLTRSVTRTIPFADDPRGNIDAPADGTNVPRGLVSVSGWAIDRNAPTGVGIDSVTLYLDGGPGTGTLLGSATRGDSRPDVGTYFNDHRLDTSGWHFNWDTSALPEGSHTLYAVIHGPTYDRTATLTRTIGGSLPYPSDPTGNVDVPSDNQAVGNGALTLQGWAIDRNGTSGTGIDLVTVYLDGTDAAHRLGTATLGDSRPDVGTYFGDHRFDSAGWDFATDTTSLSFGSHTYYVLAHSSVTGRTTTLSRAINKPLPYPNDPRGNVDDPAEGATVTGTVRLDGWFIDRNASSGTGIDSVSVYLDGTDAAHLLGTATYGDSRPDVGTYFGDHRLDNSGFHYDWSTSGVPAGTHTLYLVAHSSATGTTITLVRDVTVPVAASQPRGVISSAPGTTFTYTYDGDGLLRTRSDGTTTTTYTWDTSQVPAVLIRTTAGSSVTQIVAGHGALYADQSGVLTALARDGHASVRADVGTDGTSLATFSYSAYGAPQGSSVSSLGYASELMDPSGLIYLRARWYDPAVGYFLSRDPRAGDVADPSSLNGYVYAAANPIRFTDPTGRCPFCIVAVVLANPITRGALIGGFSYLAGKMITNHFEGKPIGDGINGVDLAIAVTAGALTGGLVPEAAPLLTRVVSGGAIAGGTEGARQLAAAVLFGAKPDANRISLAAGFGMYGGLYSPTGIIITAGTTALLDAVQNVADDLFDAKEPPVSSVPASGKGH